MDMVLTAIISVVTLGIGAQWLAWRIRLPSILVLLFCGFLIGPVTGFLKPDDLFGDLLFPWVSISVAIILFEGGLTLKIAELEKIGKVVRNLVSTGLLLTWGLVTWAAVWLLDMRLSLAALLGAILTVTGPTVIMPLLRSLRLSDRLSSILKWEAMLNDPIGAILAVLVFEAILLSGSHGHEGAATHALVGLLKTIVIGIGVGAIASWIMKELLRRYWVPDFLQSSFTLMTVVTIFGLSNMLQAESGLVAVTIAGIMMANQKAIIVKHIIEFKENLRVLLISTLFIVLGARLDFQYLSHLGWQHFGFILFLFFVVRPAAIFVSSIGSDLNWREKIFLSWLCPRGIVAAAVASIFALQLENAGYQEANEFLAVMFLVIASTVLVYGITAPWVAHWLKLAQPNPQGVVIAGAHDWAREIAYALKDFNFQVLMIDTNIAHVRDARKKGVQAIRRDILAESLLDEIELNGIGRFLAITQNDEVNSLSSILFSEIFGRSGIYQLHPSEGNRDTIRLDTKRAHGRLLFNEKITHEYLEHAFEHGAKVRSFLLTEQYNYEKFQEEFGETSTILFVISETGKELKIVTSDQPAAPKVGQTLITVVFSEADKKQPTS